jgi:hypothetical protein
MRHIAGGNRVKIWMRQLSIDRHKSIVFPVVDATAATIAPASKSKHIRVTAPQTALCHRVDTLRGAESRNEGSLHGEKQVVRFGMTTILRISDGFICVCIPYNL